MTPEERERVAALLQTDMPYRAIAREVPTVSEWSVRKLDRELCGDPRPMKRPKPPPAASPPEGDSSGTGLIVLGGVLALGALAIWAARRWALPLEFPDVPPGFIPNPPKEKEEQ